VVEVTRSNSIPAKELPQVIGKTGVAVPVTHDSAFW
jgi:hypothetical protein